MTSNQINFILSYLGFSNVSDDTVLNLTKVANITLTSNENLYPSNDCRFQFDKTNSILYQYKTHKDKDGNYVVDSKPECGIEFNEIQAFILTGPSFRKNSYIMGLQV